jgi:predicted MFS family arabinose efflux permease
MVVGTALATVPAAALMQRVGRRLGFASAALAAALASVVAAYALGRGSLALFCLAALVIGANNAFVQQYRFAAAESTGAALAGRAISLVLVGAMGGAVLGPRLAVWSDGSGASSYATPMLALAALYGVVALLALGLRQTSAEGQAGSGPAPRPLGQIARQPAYIIAVMAGVVGSGLMTLLMTAAPLSMHRADGHSLDAAAGVIGAHVMAMYAPSLVLGALIERAGLVRTMSIGSVIFVAAVAVALSGVELLHYGASMILLGVGWNFLYIGGTTLLVRTYHPSERSRAQALNEFAVFGSSALASLLSGTLIYFFGWNTLLLVALPLIAVMGLGLLWIRNDPLLRPAASSISPVRDRP